MLFASSAEIPWHVMLSRTGIMLDGCRLLVSTITSVVTSACYLLVAWWCVGSAKSGKGGKQRDRGQTDEAA